MSFLIPEAENEVQRYRIQDMLQQGYVRVWSNRRFPSAHLPDVITLKENIFIGGSPPGGFEPYPLLKPEYKAESGATIQALADIDAVKKIAWYDPFTRKMIFYPPSLALSDQKLRRVVYHEAATDTFGRRAIISSDQYSTEQVEIIDEAIKETILPDAGIAVNDTNILKLGFRRVLMVGEYAVCDLKPEELLIADEIYPNAFEIITDQIMRRQGDIRSFDQDARSGKLQMPMLDANINFARVLFAALQVVDWRDILTAVKTADAKQVVAHLENTSAKPEYAENILLRLMQAIEADEQNVFTVNKFLGYSGE